MESFKTLLQESEAVTNTTGDAIANKETPLTKKIVKRKPVEQITEETPFSFSVGTFAGKMQFTIPHAQYEKMRYGRERHSRWESFAGQGDFQDAIRNALYKDGRAMVTSDQTGASVILKHQRLQRIKAEDEIVMSESFNPEIEVPVSYGDGDDDEIFDPAYDFAMDELHYDEDDSNMFANVILAFFEAYYSDDGLDEDGALEAAYKLVEWENYTFGSFNDPASVKMAVLKYLQDNYDFGEEDYEEDE